MKINYIKALFFVTLLLIYPNLYAESYSSVSVMDVIDRGEDYYVLISNKVNSFLCIKKNQIMDTSLGRMLKSLLCRNKNEVIDINNNEWEQDKYIDQLLKESEQTPEIPDFEFVTIEPDSFIMGSPKNEKYRNPDEDQVTVTISHPFAIMTTEVTQMQWFIITKKNPSRFSKRVNCESDFIVMPTEKWKY